MAYMLEDSDPAELLQAVRAAAAGYALFSPRVAKHILSATTRRHPEELTARARQVLVLLGQGLTNQLIARRLGISEKTVKGHLTSIFVRIGVTDRVHAALWAQERRQWLEAG